MNWFKTIIMKIAQIDNQPLLNQINNLKNQVKTLDLELKKLKNTLIDKDNQLSLLQDQLNKCNTSYKELEKRFNAYKKLRYNKHASLETYKEWLFKNIKPTKIFYDFGKGRRQLHTIFAESIKDENIIRDFIKNDLKFNVHRFNIKTADDLVYFFNREFNRRYPVRKYYRFDQQLYGKIEYWATAKETINNIRTKKVYGDCDDVMVLKYSCLYLLLRDNFPDDLWRLRGFIVDLWTGGGHAMLGWVKEGVNDWVPIETTFFPSRFDEVWYKNYRIRNQMLYQIRYSFDNNYEYMR